MTGSQDKELIYANGARRRFIRTAEETGGELLEMDVTYPPVSEAPPGHFHPNQEEHFEVLAGVFRVRLAGQEQVYHPGETFSVPKAAEHWMQNISEEEGRVIWQVRPALRTQAFFTSMWRAAENSSSGRPNLLQLAVLLQAYRAEFVPSRPPQIIQRILFGILAPLGRLLGYRL